MREAQAESSFSLRSSKKKLSKKLLKTFGSLKIIPYLCTRFWEVNLEAELRKKLRKKFRKNLEDIRKTPYLCNRFPIKTEGIKKSDLWRDLHKQYSSTRAKLETVLGKKRTVNTCKSRGSGIVAIQLPATGARVSNTYPTFRLLGDSLSKERLIPDSINFPHGLFIKDSSVTDGDAFH